jgi:hypothetical protein
MNQAVQSETVTTVLKFRPNIHIHLLASKPEGISDDVLGNYGYYLEDHYNDERQYFYMTVNGVVAHPRLHKEIDMIASLGRYLERKFRAKRLKVTGFKLPQSHGFSGNRYDYFQVVQLFEHAGI